MKSGTNQAVLIRDLFTADGPYDTLADHFVAGVCSRCGIQGDDQTRFIGNLYLCEACASDTRR